MKKYVLVLLAVMSVANFALASESASSESAPVAKLECNNTSQTIKELIMVLKMKYQLDATAKEILKKTNEAKTCEELDAIRLGVIGYVLSTRLPDSPVL